MALCTNCKGFGSVVVAVDRETKEAVVITCPPCLGTGRAEK